VKKPRKSDSHRRLLDLLAGWGYVASRDRHARAEEADVAALYQRAGRLDPGTTEQVAGFLLAELLPFVRGGRLRAGARAKGRGATGPSTTSPPVNAMRPIHPGEILRREFLVPARMSTIDLARRTGVSRAILATIVRESRSITAEVALRLSRALGTSAELWMNLQQAYDLRCARKRLDPELDAVATPPARPSP